jgi:CrcB protein
MTNIVVIGIAGLIGTLCRYWLFNAIDARAGSDFPFGTVAVNLLGCLLIGFLFQIFEHRNVNSAVRFAIFIGFLGGFTTFSSFGIQTFNLMRNGQLALAGLNIGISNVGGLLCVWIGYVIARSL